MRVLAIFLLLLCWSTPRAHAACSGSGQAWSCTPGTSVAEVNAALNAAPDNATLTFAAGAYAWSSAISPLNSKGVTLACAVQGACVVTVGGNILTLTIRGDNTKLYRVTGFRFQNAPACLCLWILGNGTVSQVRIDHNIFQDFNSGAVAVFFGATDAAGRYYGVVDHNLFTGSSNFMALMVLGHGDPDTWGPSPKGTANNLYFEDNTIAFTTNVNLGAGCMDVWNSGAVVWRYNWSQNCLVTAHGVTHGGVINFEVYKNTLVRTANSGGWEDGTRLFHHQGSGEFLAFDNVFTAVGRSGSALAMTHYRSASPSVAGYSQALGRCDGTRPIDGNRLPSGYPCWRQPGRDGSQTLQPMYAWGNRWSDTGSRVDLIVENPWAATNPSVGDHIQPDRDFYNAVSATAQTSPSAPFQGSTGMGFGTLANRPAACTTNAFEAGGGVGYFATDQGPHGTLYRCAASGQWVVHYAPFTYPHPLQLLALPPAPTGLRLVR